MNCRYNWSDPVTESFNQQETREEAHDSSSQLGYTLEEVFISCKYKAQQKNCSELFTTIILSSGKRSNIASCLTELTWHFPFGDYHNLIAYCSCRLMARVFLVFIHLKGPVD